MTTSHEIAMLPVGIAGMSGFLHIWVVEIDAPFLTSKQVLKNLGTLLGLDANQAVLRKLPGAPVVDLDEGDTGHYCLRLIDVAALSPSHDKDR